MSLSVSQNKDLYKAALNQFVSEAQFYAGQAQDYLVNLSMGERLLGLCAFIMLVMYIIVSRAICCRCDPSVYRRLRNRLDV